MCYNIHSDDISGIYGYQLVSLVRQLAHQKRWRKNRRIGVSIWIQGWAFFCDPASWQPALKLFPGPAGPVATMVTSCEVLRCSRRGGTLQYVARAFALRFGIFWIHGKRDSHVLPRWIAQRISIDFSTVLLVHTHRITLTMRHLPRFLFQVVLDRVKPPTWEDLA